jgi:hypothetical protein
MLLLAILALAAALRFAGYVRFRTLLWAGLAIAASGTAFAFKITALATVALPLGVLALRPPSGFLRAGRGSDQTFSKPRV